MISIVLSLWFETIINYTVKYLFYLVDFYLITTKHWFYFIGTIWVVFGQNFTVFYTVPFYNLSLICFPFRY